MKMKRKEDKTMIPGMDPAKLAAVQQTSQHINAEIEVNYNESAVKIAMTSENPEAVAMIPGLLKQFAEGLAVQLQSFFAIKGQLVEVGKK
jgi:hypothetical protein